MATTVQTVNTADQIRQDFQYSDSVNGLLKNVYIPALNNTVFHATPLLEMFGNYGGVIDFVGNKIIKAFKHQGAGAFRAIPEGGSFATPKDQKGFQGAERIRYLNAIFSLSGPAAATVREGQGAYVDAVSSGMDDTLKNAQMNMERIIGGAGNGLVATFVGTGVSCATVQTQTGTAGTGGYSPCQWLSEGLMVDICTDTAGALLHAATIHAIVTAVDYAAGTFGLQTFTTSTGVAQATTPTASTTYYLTLHNTYGDVEAEGTVTADSCLEPNGLYNLVSDTEGATGYIWGLDRATYPNVLKSVVVDGAGTLDLTDELLMGYILDLTNLKQSVPNALVSDPKTRLKYFTWNHADDRQFNMPIIDTPFGFKSTGVVIDQYTLILQSLASLVPGTLFMLNTGDFKFAQASNGFQWITDNGQILRNYETKDAMFATATSYMNFVCENPRGQLKVTDIQYE